MYDTIVGTKLSELKNLEEVISSKNENIKRLNNTVELKDAEVKC